MNARISMTLTADSAEDAQKMLNDLLERLKAEGTVRDYSFEIETASGMITDKCIFAEGTVVA